MTGSSLTANWQVIIRYKKNLREKRLPMMEWEISSTIRSKGFLSGKDFCLKVSAEIILKKGS
jgi:hypothetical protein